MLRFCFAPPCRSGASVLLLAFQACISPLSRSGVRALASQSKEVFPSNFQTKGGKRVRTVSWNVAAVNNNPFEYWITHPNPAYKQLMESVEQFIVAPGEDDVPVHSLVTDAMYQRLHEKMSEIGLSELDIVRRMWETDYRDRRVVSQFLKDPVIGKKRLASMPDRVTNTIQLASGSSAFRPTVINCYPQEIGSVDAWFEQWISFFFEQKVDVDGKGARPVYSLLQPIKKSKYPAVSEEEEAASIPLQIVLQAVFDAVLVNAMQTKAGDLWQGLRREICESLNSRKNTRIREILQSTYKVADVIFLQEAGNQLLDMLKKDYGEMFHIITPKNYNAKRNQNSIMMLRASLVSDPTEFEVESKGWEAGDLLAVRGTIDNVAYVFASFHGDTNGLLTIPVVTAVKNHVDVQVAGLLFGLDANTHAKSSSSTAYVGDFEEVRKVLGIESCWGDNLDPRQHTTFNARTYLQPQLNKAAKSDELEKKGDRNPKDFVLFSKHFEVVDVWRDNTGRGEFVEDIVFPSLEFPSDHATVAVDLRLKPFGMRPEL